MKRWFIFSVHFMALIAVIGFAKAITTGNSVPLAQELVGADNMMDLYVLKAFVDGLCSAGVPFLAGKRHSLFFYPGISTSLYVKYISILSIYRFIHQTNNGSAVQWWCKNLQYEWWSNGCLIFCCCYCYCRSHLKYEQSDRNFPQYIFTEQQ